MYPKRKRPTWSSARPLAGSSVRAEEITGIARKLRNKAGLGDEPTGEVMNPGNGGIVGKVADKVTP